MTPKRRKKPLKVSRPAVFLDRDGVIIEDGHYLHATAAIKVIPGAASAIVRLRRAGFRIIVVTNQSAVARGTLTLKGLRDIHKELEGRLRRHKARLDEIYFCPHLPKITGPCRCRKPKTGMFMKARRRFKLDLDRCVMVGDTTTDLKAARNAGCRAVLVRTGKGGKDGRYKVRADATCKDLRAAADWILKNS